MMLRLLAMIADAAPHDDRSLQRRAAAKLT
jgi:hypothetical protein